MVELRLLAIFDTSPEKANRQFIEKRLSSFLSELAPETEFEVTTSEGSWWILLSGIVGTAVLTWVVSEGLDYLKSHASPSEKPETTEINARFLETEEAPNDDVKKITNFLNNLCQITEDIKASQFICSEWNEEQQEGRIACIYQKEGDRTVHLHRTNSQEDFISRTSPPNSNKEE